MLQLSEHPPVPTCSNKWPPTVLSTIDHISEYNVKLVGHLKRNLKSLITIADLQSRVQGSVPHHQLVLAAFLAAPTNVTHSVCHLVSYTSTSRALWMTYNHRFLHELSRFQAHSLSVIEHNFELLGFDAMNSKLSGFYLELWVWGEPLSEGFWGDNRQYIFGILGLSRLFLMQSVR